MPVLQRAVEDLVAPIQINPSISQRVNDAIMAAMEIKPKDRVQTVTEFMQRLGQPLKPNIFHQLFGGAKVAWSNQQTNKQIAGQAAKIAAAEKQANLERQQRQWAEREAQVAREQLQQSEAEKQRLSNELQLQQQRIELRSAQGIDYSELNKLLNNKQWHEADQLTNRLMLKASGREKEGWIGDDSTKNFPCEDLQTIDRLWVHYSNGLYGFSVQKQIYVECGGTLDFSYPSTDTWEKFCDRTAWKSEGKWVSYPCQFFLNNFMNVKGHLPLGVFRLGSGLVDVEGGVAYKGGMGRVLFSHRDL